MKDKERKTAERFGILKRIKVLEADLLKIDGVTEVDFDLDGFYDNLQQVIFLAKYKISISDPNYFTKRKWLKTDVVKTAEEHGLKLAGDEIEDYGEHFYFVFQTDDDAWHPKNRRNT